MDVEFLGQPFSEERRLGAVLAELLEDADSFLAITAWAQMSGMSAIESEIRALRARGGTATALLGVDGGIATRESLELAVDLFDSASVFHDTGNRTFHPKIYCIEQSAETALIVGSSNFTGRGLFENYEANVVIRLASDNRADQDLRESVLDFRSSLVEDGMPCKPLTHALIARLADDEALLKSAERLFQSEAVARAKAESVARKVFGPAVRGLPARPRRSTTARGEAPAAAASDTTTNGDPGMSAAPAELRWWKKLTASDVLRKRKESHQRKYVVLGDAGRGINRNTWFRHDLFGPANWVTEPMRRSGKPKDVAHIEFDVWIADDAIGRFELRIDHAENRIADQKNAPTYLNWSTMADLIREKDFRDWWLELARLSDGSFRLRLLRDEPVLG